MKPKHFFTFVCIVLLFAFVPPGCGSDDSAFDSATQPENPSDNAVFDAYATAEKFWDSNIYSEEEKFIAFAEEISILDEEKTHELIQAIDEIFSEKNQNYLLYSYSGIPVYWDSWPSGRYPNSVFVTTKCNGDYDVGCRYDSVKNAYSKPSSLWFETNNAVVYGIVKAAHGGKVTAYEINTSNQVYICVGVGSNNYWYVKAISSYFWGGLAINS